MPVFPVAALSASPAPATEAFARYATRVRRDPPRIVVQRQTSWSRHYRSDIARQAHGPVDFAGRYTLVTIGCGAECLMLGAVDRWSGRVAQVAPTVCCWPDAVSEPLRYRMDSRLLVVQGRLDEAGAAGIHRFVLRHGRFTRLPDEAADGDTAP